MGYDNKGLPHVASQVEKQFVKFATIGAVEASRGLVGENHSGTVHERTGHSGTLPFTTRELGGFVAHAVGKPHIFNEFLRVSKGLFPPGAGNKGRHCHIFEHGELGQKLMKLKHKTDVAVAKSRELFLGHTKHIGAVVEHCAAIGAVNGAHDVKERGFSRTAGAHNGENLTVGHRKVHTLDNLKGVVALSYVAKFNHRALQACEWRESVVLVEHLGETHNGCLGAYTTV